MAIETIRAFLLENEMLVYLVVFDRAAYQISEALFSDITAYIDDRYADARAIRREPRIRMPSLAEAEDDRNDSWMDTLRAKAPEPLQQGVAGVRGSVVFARRCAG